MCPNASSHEDICGVKELLHVILTSKRDWVSKIGRFTPGKKPPVLINKRMGWYYNRFGSSGEQMNLFLLPVIEFVDHVPWFRCKVGGIPLISSEVDLRPDHVGEVQWKVLL
jgi:hypothetical protein